MWRRVCWIYPDCGVCLRNVHTLLPNVTASHPRRHQVLEPSPWYSSPSASYLTVLFFISSFIHFLFSNVVLSLILLYLPQNTAFWDVRRSSCRRHWFLTETCCFHLQGSCKPQNSLTHSLTHSLLSIYTHFQSTCPTGPVYVTLLCQLAYQCLCTINSLEIT